MDCKTIEEFLYTCRLDELDLPHDGVMMHYIKRCDKCQNSYNSVTQYLQTIDKISPPQLTPTHAEYLLQSVQAAQQPQVSETSTSWSWIAQGSAIACSLALVFILGFFAQTPSSPLAPANINAGIAAQAELDASIISLMIEVPADMLQANLTLEFPEQLRWQGLEEMQRIAWPVDLEKGVNVLELPVTLTSQLDSEQPLIITGSLEYQQSTKHFQLPVNTSSLPPYRQHINTII